MVRGLEDRSESVVKGDWKDHISIELYNGEFVYVFICNNCVTLYMLYVL